MRFPLPDKLEIVKSRPPGLPFTVNTYQNIGAVFSVEICKFN